MTVVPFSLDSDDLDFILLGLSAFLDAHRFLEWSFLGCFCDDRNASWLKEAQL